jgi:HK97 family phage major capsid protein
MTNFAAAAEYYRGLFAEQVALTADIQFLRGALSAYAPLGLKHQAAATHQILQSGTSLTNVVTDAYRLIGLLEDYNIPNPQEAVFISNTRPRRTIAGLRDGVGNFIFPTMNEMEPSLMGHRFLTTTAIPNNLNGTQTEWYILHPRQVMAVYLEMMQVRSSGDISYTDGNGTLVSAWERGEVATNVTLWADARALRPEGLAVITDSTL